MLKKGTFVTLLFSLIALNNGAVMAAGDPAAGEAKSAVCAACHGPTGISSLSINPNIAGHVPGYISAQLKAFKSGERVNAVMAGQAAILSDQDMEDLDAFYAAQEPNYDMPMTDADKALAEEGEKNLPWWLCAAGNLSLHGVSRPKRAWYPEKLSSRFSTAQRVSRATTVGLQERRTSWLQRRHEGHLIWFERATN